VRYRFVTDAPRGPDGKRRQVTHTFDTLREARDALAKIRTESSTGRYVHADKMTLDEYLSEWLAAIGRGVEPGTLRAPRTISLGIGQFVADDAADQATWLTGSSRD
jgi:Arm DNA-binding domain